MRRASGQRRGSVVIMPSTSVQISIREAFSSPPAIAAVKSEPPRPRVVEMPSRVEPIKPPITGTRPRSSSGFTICSSRALVSSNCGTALPKLASVTMHWRESTWVAQIPRCENAAAAILLETRSPKPAMLSVERGVSSPTATMPRSRSSRPLKSASSSGCICVKPCVPSNS